MNFVSFTRVVHQNRLWTWYSLHGLSITSRTKTDANLTEPVIGFTHENGILSVGLEQSFLVHDTPIVLGNKIGRLHKVMQGRFKILCLIQA